MNPRTTACLAAGILAAITVSDGAAQSQEVRSWTADRGAQCEGLFVDGTKQGTHICEHEGNVTELPFVDGVRHGTAITRTVDGHRMETPYVRGKRHGWAVMRWADGTVQRIRYENDRRVE